MYSVHADRGKVEVISYIRCMSVLCYARAFDIPTDLGRESSSPTLQDSQALDRPKKIK